MFEKLMKAAERPATEVSRRRFLGRFGRAALVAAGAITGVLALPMLAEAGQRCLSNAECPPKQACNDLGRCVHIGKR